MPSAQTRGRSGPRRRTAAAAHRVPSKLTATPPIPSISPITGRLRPRSTNEGTIILWLNRGPALQASTSSRPMRTARLPRALRRFGRWERMLSRSTAIATRRNGIDRRTERPVRPNRVAVQPSEGSTIRNRPPLRAMPT
ncbi:hypothetical protein MMSR116_23680 [Methylobacterium mesophilicum SR1.6/6]|uniref:Uncharacterized protein n=1 Tax=Methylobacterium mesophilicum SR1.6/6 TaxID=908290 RepID=A0A6B9FPL2_9HYPH|nr:hypothetical protein MMSR116_23680 [Methylobacterium mesophilicum SR1.6/6]